jgi:tetratricopeptide (TPR) repeat protein
LNLALFLESLENLSAAEFGHFAAEATSAARSSARSACLALCAIGTGDGEAAARWIEDAIHIDRPSDFVSFASALVSMQTGNIASAIEPLRKIDERFVKYRDARVLLATAYLYSGWSACAMRAGTHGRILGPKSLPASADICSAVRVGPARA